MRDLNYDFKQLCRHNRDGSYATQADREHILDLCADQLYEMGVPAICVPRDSSPSTSRSWSTLAGRAARVRHAQEPHEPLRWLAQKIGKENIVERTNAAYSIRDRVYVTNVDKGKDLDRPQLEQIRCVWFCHLRRPGSNH